ncbi:MAG TPA: SbcC/MukB-like Walker B domain-containing protein, partial [Acidimicrobiales bacterium]|nr:SbcC/MukB-like Walker B domain-containing protein [Acidimicrobiales bacterium]
RMERLATAFARLDEESAALERLEASAGELHSFLEHYRAHARIQTRLRAGEVRSANTQFDRVTEKARIERDKHVRASAVLADIDGRLAGLAADIVRANGQLAGLDLSKVHALDEVGKRATAAEATARAMERRAAQDRPAADRDASRSMQASAAAAAAAATRDELLDAAAGASVAGGVAREHELHRARLLEEPERAKVALRGVVDRREELVRGVRVADAAAESARRRIAADHAAWEESEAALEASRRSLGTAESELEAAVADLVHEVAAWSAQWAVGVPESHLDALVAGERVTALPLLVVPRQALAADRSSVGGERALVADRREVAVAERDRVAAEADLAPGPRPGRPAGRPDGFVPLWSCVDFEPSMSESQRAGLEAGLEASGVLDALVGPAGEVLDAETLDTLIVPSSASGSVPGLVPSGPHGDAAGRALAALGDAGWWSADGRWSLGPLAGRWTKGSAEFIGAAARAEARRRRIAELTATIDDADSELARLDESLARLDEESARLDSAERAWPATDRLLLARRERDRCVGLVSDSTATAERAMGRLERSRAEGQAALKALAEASAAAGCTAEAVDEVLRALGRYREALGEAVAAVRAAGAAAAVAEEAVARASESEARAAESEATAARSRQAALAARAEEEELRRTSGADAEAVLARQRDLTEQLERFTREQAELRDHRDGARDEVATATALLEAAEGERAQRERVRAVALERLAALASTELALLALGPVDRDRDLTQVTAGLTFARTAHERLKDVDVDQRAIDAAATRFHNAYTTLQSQLGVDFNPYLDASDGLEVCFGTLNGQTVMLSELSASIDDQVHRRRETLTADERELIHRHLLTEVGSHLGERVHAAWALTRKMNEQLAQHPTRAGVSLELAWDVAPDAGPGAEQAARLLRQDVHLLDEPQRVALANFLHERVRAAREDREGADMVERLAGALDYRRWHRFSVFRVSAGRKEKLTSRTQGVGSGGEQAKLVHLPLFAATAAYYASARADAPRLLMLDEAFAGIDDSQRGDC